MHKAPKITVALVGLALLLAVFVLVPPHLQVRSVEPSLPNEAQLRALMSMENRPVSLRYVITAAQDLPSGVLGHAVFVAEWANGNLFMVDAGMDRTAASEFAELLGLIADGGENVVHGSAAELLGDDILHVMGVGLTHLHIDHTQGLVAFCERRGAGAIVYQTSWQAELHNFNTEEGAAIVAESCLQQAEVSGEGIMTPDGFPGLGIVAVGGHTPGSTLFAIATEDRLWLLSGDTTNTKEELLANTGKGFVYSNILVPENTARTEVLRLWLASLDSNDDMTVVVSHDLASLEASGMVQHAR